MRCVSSTTTRFNLLRNTADLSNLKNLLFSPQTFRYINRILQRRFVKTHKLSRSPPTTTTCCPWTIKDVILLSFSLEMWSHINAFNCEITNIYNRTLQPKPDQSEIYQNRWAEQREHPFVSGQRILPLGVALFLIPLNPDLSRTCQLLQNFFPVCSEAMLIYSARGKTRKHGARHF